MSMPGYREQYPEENDRDRDDWIDGYLAMQHEQFLYNQEQQADGLTDMDYLILDMMIMDDDWW